jgi:hypothetical protein
MADAFHGFSLELQAVGNAKEAGNFRALQNDRQQKILVAQRRHGAAIVYGLWKITSNYGESLGRWVIMCIVVILSFAFAYGRFGTITSGVDSTDKSLRFYDYIYFSIVTFTTLGYGDLHPIGLTGQILACAEVIFGVIMFGVLLSFVGSRLQRG